MNVVRLLSEILLKIPLEEKGTSNNWTYIKRADGTMIAWRNPSITVNITTASGSIYTTSQAITYDLPKGFIAAPHVFANADNGYRTWAKACNATTTSVAIVYMSSTSASRSTVTDMFAIGKWK